MLSRLKQLFQSKTTGITAAAILIAVFSLISRLLGIFRDRILAGQFGAGDILDAYYSAFRIPDLIYNLLILGALSAGFIPIFSSLIKKMKSSDGKGNFFDCSKEENKEAWNLVSNLLNVLIIVLLFFSLLGFIFAPQLINLITPGFSSELKDTAITLTRIMFFSPLFLGISSLLGGVLQSFKNFFIFSLAPIFYNLGIIAGALWLVPIMGVAGLAWGVVFGAFLHMVIQIPTVRSLGFCWRLFYLNLREKNFREIVKMMVPRTLSLAITQINLLVITIIASTLDSGSLTVFNFANNLQSFPIGIFGISFAVAVFPTLSAAAFDNEKLIKNFSYTLRQILFFIIPSTILFITLRAQIIRVIYGTGEFSWQDTILTIDALGFFALSLFAQATIPLLTRVFYARHNSRTPFFVGLISVVINIFLSIFFSERMGVSGLALAFSLSSILNFMILWMWLYFEIGELDQRKIIKSVVKFSIAGLGAGLFIQLGKIMIWPFIDMTRFLGVLSQGLFAGLFGLFIYCLLCYLMKSEEILEIIEVIKRKMPFSRRIKKDPDLGDQSEARGI
jgi:putative peptidoglycan lipid II flippase